MQKQEMGRRVRALMKRVMWGFAGSMLVVAGAQAAAADPALGS
jgi:hypothetical protein